MANPARFCDCFTGLDAATLHTGDVRRTQVTGAVCRAERPACSHRIEPADPEAARSYRGIRGYRSYGGEFDVVHLCGVERAMSLLERTPSLAQVGDNNGDPLAFYLYPDIDRLDEMIALLNEYGVDLNATGCGGARLLDHGLEWHR